MLWAACWNATNRAKAGPVTNGPVGSPAKRREVVLTDERIDTKAQGVEIEVTIDVPGRAGQERVGHGTRGDRVAVAAPLGREAGVEVAIGLNE